MNFITKYLNGLGRTSRTVILGLAVIFVSAGIAQAATTITTDITTANLTTTAALTVGTTATVGTTLGVTATTTTNGLTVTNSALVASTTATAFKVGNAGTQISQVVSGYCVAAAITIPATNASSTQTYATCTPSGSVTLLGTTANRVFVQATSSLPSYIVVQAASSTAAGLIQVALTNFSTTTSPTVATYAFNFWAFQ